MLVTCTRTTATDSHQFASLLRIFAPPSHKGHFPEHHRHRKVSVDHKIPHLPRFLVLDLIGKQHWRREQPLGTLR